MKKSLMAIFMAWLGAHGAALAAESRDYDVPVGARLTLLKPIEIPAASATVRLQFGKLVSFAQTQDFEPACVFESRVVSDSPQVIAPDVFEIVQVRRGYSTRWAEATSGLQKVGLRSADAGGGSRFYFKTEMFLRSQKQPQILAMTCQHAWESGFADIDMRPLTVTEIRQAMDGYFTLHLRGNE